MAQRGDFWGENDYINLLQSVGALPDAQRSILNDNPFLASPVPPTDSSFFSTNWWNRPHPRRRYRRRERGQAEAAEPEQIRIQRTPGSSDAPPDPLQPIPDWRKTVLQTSSPHYIAVWTHGATLIMAICLICGGIQAQGFQSFRVNPMYGFDDSTMIQMGAKFGPLITRGEWWRLFTAIFMQNGCISYLYTFFALEFCATIENRWGFWMASCSFVMCGMFGYIISSLFIPYALTCGGTPAVSGYIGILACDVVCRWKVSQRRWKNLFSVVLMFVLETVMGLTPYVDQWAQLGGLVMGVMWGVVLAQTSGFRGLARTCCGVLSFLTFPVMSLLFMICLVLLFRRTEILDDWCLSCYSINCICVAEWCGT